MTYTILQIDGETNETRYEINNLDGFTVAVVDTLAEAQLFSSSIDMLDLLIEALPYVEEGEEFNKPSARGLSKKIRAIIERQKGGNHAN